jgi:hypothetical protein
METVASSNPTQQVGLLEQSPRHVTSLLSVLRYGYVDAEGLNGGIHNAIWGRSFWPAVASAYSRCTCPRYHQAERAPPCTGMLGTAAFHRGMLLYKSDHK